MGLFDVRESAFSAVVEEGARGVVPSHVDRLILVSGVVRDGLELLVREVCGQESRGLDLVAFDVLAPDVVVDEDWLCHQFPFAECFGVGHEFALEELGNFDFSRAGRLLPDNSGHFSVGVAVDCDLRNVARKPELMEIGVRFSHCFETGGPHSVEDPLLAGGCFERLLMA